MHSPERCRCHLNLASALFLRADLRFEGVMLAATKMIRRKIQKEFTLGAQDDIEDKVDPAPGHTQPKKGTSCKPELLQEGQEAASEGDAALHCGCRAQGCRPPAARQADGDPRVVVTRPAKFGGWSWAHSAETLYIVYIYIYIYIYIYCSPILGKHMLNHVELDVSLIYLW